MENVLYTLLKEFGVIGAPSKTYELISECNKKILINSTVNEIKQHCSMSIPEKIYEGPSNVILDTKNA